MEPSDDDDDSTELGTGTQSDYQKSMTATARSNGTLG